MFMLPRELGSGETPRLRDAKAAFTRAVSNGRITSMKYFGTDGFRGRANEGLNVDHAFKIGRFVGWYYGARRGKKATCSSPR